MTKHCFEKRRGSRLLFIIMLFSLTCLLPSSSLADVILDNSQSQIVIGKGIDYIEDIDGVMSKEDILVESVKWQKSNEKIFNKGYSSSTWWLRFNVSNHSKLKNWYLVINYPVLDYIQIYQIDPHGNQEYWRLGDKLPFQSRPLKNRSFVVPVHVPVQSKTEFLIRVQTSSSVQVPVSLWKPEDFSAEDSKETLLQGAFYGALVVIAVYNLLLFFALREDVYLLYVGYVLNMAIFSASLGGWTYQYLWPNASQWNDQALLVTLNLAMFFGSAFTSRFLTHQINKNANRVQLSFCGIAIVLALLSFWLPYSRLIRIVVLFAAVISIWGLSIGVYAWIKKIAAARLYTIAWGMLLSSVVIIVLNKYDVLPKNALTDYAIQIGTVMEMVLLSFALAERINNERTMRLRAQNRALEIQRKATAELEGRVAERTRALEEVNKKLEELSATDQLTGLKNRRYLDKFLEHEVSRCIRYNHELAVLLLDIDHFKRVNDEHGHLTGDDCLQEIAKRIQQTLRQTDLAARYGGEEFCIVLLEQSAKSAEQVAERIRNNISNKPIDTRTGALDITLSIGCKAGIPQADDLPSGFVEQADKALYQSKENGRNRVTMA